MIKALATDLDGTLIPLNGDAKQKNDLQILTAELRTNGTALVFVTGRHADSAIAACEEHSLPRPDAIICNVGTTVLTFQKGTFVANAAYAEQLQSISSGVTSEHLQTFLSDIAEVRLQESHKQAMFKLSYYVKASYLGEVAERMKDRLQQHSAPWEVIASVDPFNGDGLIDVLPTGVSKAFAIEWWSRHQNFQTTELVFAGDSGNDIAALTAEWNAILVGNAASDVVTETQRLRASGKGASKLFHSVHPASSGVLDGFRHFINLS